MVLSSKEGRRNYLKLGYADIKDETRLGQLGVVGDSSIWIRKGQLGSLEFSAP